MANLLVKCWSTVAISVFFLFIYSIVFLYGSQSNLIVIDTTNLESVEIKIQVRASPPSNTSRKVQDISDSLTTVHLEETNETYTLYMDLASKMFWIEGDVNQPEQKWLRASLHLASYEKEKEPIFHQPEEVVACFDGNPTEFDHKFRSSEVPAYKASERTPECLTRLYNKYLKKSQ